MKALKRIFELVTSYGSGVIHRFFLFSNTAGFESSMFVAVSQERLSGFLLQPQLRNNLLAYLLLEEKSLITSHWLLVICLSFFLIDPPPHPMILGLGWYRIFIFLDSIFCFKLK